MMARLVEAVRPDARLILVGDPGQLTSIEAGAVLGDLVGPAAPACACAPPPAAGSPRWPASTSRRRPPARASRSATASSCSTATTGSGARSRASPRPSGAATATRSSPRSSRATRRRVDPRATPDAARRERGAPRRAPSSRPPGRATRGEALAALGAFRVLCAHRRGPHGVAAWAARIEARLAQDVDGLEGEWYAGRPLLATANDYGIGLFNGDTGVVVAPRRASWPRSSAAAGCSRSRPRA